MSFHDDLKVEDLASPLLEAYYRSRFRFLIDIVDVSKIPEFQHIGIDKYLIFQHPNLARLDIFSIDEKVRTQPWTDFLAEVKSKKEKDIPGWVWTSRSDYIVYAFVDLHEKRLLQEPNFIPTIEFVKAIKQSTFQEKESKNKEWTTVFRLIPKSELKPDSPSSAKLEDFI